MLSIVRPLCALSLALLSTLSAAQKTDVPAKIMVGFPAGGSADTIARLLADKLRTSLMRPVIVDNRPGAGGRILASTLKTLPNDGSVVMLAPDALVTSNPFVFKKLGYEITDLVPVSLVTEFPFAMATGADTGPKSYADFLKLVSANPKMADFGSPAAGSPMHFLGLMIGKSMGIDMLHVPFQGGAALATSLISGQPTVGVNTLTDMIEMHRGGRLRILAVTGEKRSSLLPQVPTFYELGFKQVIRQGYYGLYAPAGTPASVIKVWNSAVQQALQSPDLREKLSAMGMVVKGSSPEELAQMGRDDAAIWGPVIKASGFSVD